MNKAHSYIIFLLLIVSCSEGDIIQDDIDFTANLESCSNGDDFVFYKIDNDINQSLSVNFTSTSFDITPETNDISVTAPTVITLSSSNSLIYRKFNSPVNGQDYFCSSIPPSNISVTEELISTNGSLEISYEALAPTVNSQERFRRTITLKNVTLVGDRGIIRKEYLLLGSDEINADISIDFSGTLRNCPDTNGTNFVFYKLNSDANTSLSFNFMSATFDITPAIEDISVDTPIVITLDATNTITFREFDSAIAETDFVEAFCNNNFPVPPNITRTLVSTSGDVEISYAELASTDTERRFRRTLTIKDLVLEGNGTPIKIETEVMGTDDLIFPK